MYKQTSAGNNDDDNTNYDNNKNNNSDVSPHPGHNEDVAADHDLLLSCFLGGGGLRGGDIFLEHCS